MARTAKTPEFAVSFGEYEETEKVNPFADIVKQLSDLDKPNAAATVTVDVNDANATKNKIQRAANDLGKTARIRHIDETAVREAGKDEDGDPIREGSVQITFTIGQRHKSRARGAKPVVPEADVKPAK